MSSVATDGMDGNGLKVEKIGQLFQVLMLHVPRNVKKFTMVSLSDEICLSIFVVALQNHFVSE